MKTSIATKWGVVRATRGIAQVTRPAPDPAPALPLDGARRGRPASTTHDDLARIGLQLFIERGYDLTSVDDIAAAAGIGRRTFFHYYRSKAEVVWGDFDAAVDAFEADLATMPSTLPVLDVVRLAVVRFNTVAAPQQELHRRRMSLILGVPSLVAYSALRYTQWRGAVARYAGGRLGLSPHALVPTTIGHCSLAASLSAYEVWLRDDGGEDLVTLVDAAFRELATGFDASGVAR